jgi:hypothetical protein
MKLTPGLAAGYLKHKVTLSLSKFVINKNDTKGLIWPKRQLTVLVA